MYATKFMKAVCLIIAMSMLTVPFGTAMVSDVPFDSGVIVMPDKDRQINPARETETVKGALIPYHGKPGIAMPDPQERLFSTGGGVAQSLGAAPEGWSYRDAHNVPSGYTGEGVVVALADTGIDFAVPNLAGSYVTVTDPESPYHGWPMAFDAAALSGYLMAKEAAEIGGFANTTKNGTGPFDIDRTITIDGLNAFASTERIPSASLNSAILPTSESRTGGDLDLQNLYVTRDETHWYMGFNTQGGSRNRTFGVALDFDGPATGSTTDPRGNLLNFEPSHSSRIRQVSYCPENDLVASSSGSEGTTSSEVNAVKVWDTDGTLVRAFPKETSTVYSLAWSPDGAYLVYQTCSEIVVYNTADWTEHLRLLHSDGAVVPDPPSASGTIAFSPDGTTLIATFLVQANRLFVLDMDTGDFDRPTGFLQSYSVAYSPDGSAFALGIQDSDVRLYNSETLAQFQHFEDLGVFTPVQTVAWSPDGQRIAAGHTGAVNIWDATAGTNVPLVNGHSEAATIYEILWMDGQIITVGSDGKVIYWDDATLEIITVRESEYGSPVTSIDVNPNNGDVFLGTADCSVRKYDDAWSGFVPFVAHRANVVIYIDYEREYYTEHMDGQLVTEGRVSDPDVYIWDTDASEWTQTKLSDIDGEYMYEGSLDGEWTSIGFLEWSLPRNITGFKDSYNMYVTGFVCGGDGQLSWNNTVSPSRPHDTVPTDANIPSGWVDWSDMDERGISAWGLITIGKAVIDHTTLNSISQHYHFGLHPSTQLTKALGPVPILVTQSTTEGVWDTVYINVNIDYSTPDFFISGSDFVVNKPSPLAAWTGIPPGTTSQHNYSGGLLYFIADGDNPLPYSHRLAELLGLGFNADNPMPIPGPGELVAFFGDFDFDEFEGLPINEGTQMASIIASQGITDGPPGMAPDIKFLPIANAHFDLESSLYFAVEGYDGRSNTGDEAHIIATGLYTSGYDSGLDAITQLVEYLAYQTNYKASFISPAGNDGSGYGTVASPCGPSALVVGFAEDNAFLSAANHHYGDVGETSSRGPTAAGLAKPDVIAVGSSITNLPLVGGFTTTTWQSASEVAVAVATGSMALVYEAYHDTHGAYPGTEKAMSLIKSTARDLGHDYFTQGSGFIDVGAALRAANGTTGLLLSSASTSFGDTFGTGYSGFMNVLAPGQSHQIPMEVTNVGTEAQSPSYSLEYLQRIAASQFNITIDPAMSVRKDISQYIPLDAQVVKLTAQTKYSGFYNIDDEGTVLGVMGDYTMSLHDWVDAQGLGDPNHPSASDIEFSRLVSTDHEEVNSLICTLAYPHNMHGKLVMEMVSSPHTTLSNRVWTLTVESFAAVDWEWAGLSKGTASIDAGITDTVNVNVNVPEGALPGTYGASLVASYGSHASSWNTSFLPSQPPDTTMWDDGSDGNYWSDHVGPDEYPIPGGINVDWHPLAEPSLTPHATITITENAQFGTYASAGDGTPGNPWIIEHLEIDAEGGPHGISIDGTDDHVIIRNSVVHNTVTGTGIAFTAVSNATVQSCDIYDNTYAIQTTDGCSDIIIRNNIIHDNTFAFVFQFSSDITVYANEIMENEYLMELYLVTDSIITGNHIHGDNMFLVESSDNVISWNWFNNTNVGAISVHFYTADNPCENNVLVNNDFTNFQPDHAFDDSFPAGTNVWDGNYWEDNEPHASPFNMDNDPLENPVFHLRPGYYQDARAPITIAGVDFTEVNGVTGGNGTIENPYIIAGWAIDASGEGHAISITETDAHFIVMHCHLHGGDGTGIEIVNAPNGIILSNTITGIETGMHIESDGLIVRLNELSHNTEAGIWLSGSQGIHVLDNVLSENGCGIRVTASTGVNHIYGNRLLDNVLQAHDDTVVYQEEYIAQSILSLPHQRVHEAGFNLKIFREQLDGSMVEAIVPFNVSYATGVVELLEEILIGGPGLHIFVNYTHYTRTAIQGLTINVYASRVAEYSFGTLENTEAPSIMPVWGVRPGQGSTMESGDRRYFYFYVPPQGRFSTTELANFFLYNELSWNLNETDLNIYIFGKGDTGILGESAPYVSRKLGSSEENSYFSFDTATQGPTEILATPFSNEVVTICVSAKTFNGTGGSPIESFEGRGGWLTMGDTNPKAWTNSPVGSMEVSLMSNIDLPGIFASIVGPAQENRTVEECYQDDVTTDGTMQGWLTINANAGFTHVITVENALSLDIRIIGHANAPDLDLAVFYDGHKGQPKDGEAQWQEIITQDFIEFDAYGQLYGTGFYAYSADWTADEAIKFINPPDGDYIIKVLAYHVTAAPAHFDMIINIIEAGVEGYRMSHVQTEHDNENTTNSAYLNSTTVDRYDMRSFNIEWAFPEDAPDNIYGGILVLGVASAQDLLTLSISIDLDREAPLIVPGFTGPGAIVSNKRPTISAVVEDLEKGEISTTGARVLFNGVDVTSVASISIIKTEDESDILGYWTGDIVYRPAAPLSEGGHFITIEAMDVAGNTRSVSWGFTVDTTKPMLALSDNRETIYTNTPTHVLTGVTEPDSVVSVIGAPSVVRQRADSTFSIELGLEDGPNFISIRSTDRAGNVYETTRTIVLDTQPPTFRRVVALDGSITNKRVTGIYGELGDPGMLHINGMLVSVNSDGTFRHEPIQLIEGTNQQVLKFTDLAGNVAYEYLNITLDTAAPTLALSGMQATVHTETVNVTGSTEAGVASLTINGKPVSVAADGSFQQSVRLSPGNNVLVVESRDRAGNTAQEILTVSFLPDTGGRNWAAIGLIIILLVICVLLAIMMFMPSLFGGRKEDAGDTPPEDMPDEGDISEEGAEDMPSDGLEETGDDMPDEGDISEEGVEDMPSDGLEETGDIPEPMEGEELPDEPAPEVREADDAMPLEEPGAEPVESDMPMEPESEEMPVEPEDPRIVKLREAYESGKISQELYEKNLARFKGQ